MKSSVPSIYQPHREIMPPLDSGMPDQEEIISIGNYLWILRKAWWKIALTVVVGTAIAAILAYTLHPIYESTAVVAVDLSLPSTLVGSNTVNGNNSGEAEADEYFTTEVQQILSDTVLRPVAQEFGLMPDMRQKHLPVGVHPTDTPVSLRGLSVVHPPNSFLINISYRSPLSSQAAAIANAVARSYIVRGRELRARASMDESAFMEKQLSQLKKSMDDSESAVAAFEKQLGVINSDEKTSILAARLQQLNTAYTDAQNDRMKKQVDLQAFNSGSLAALEVSPQAIALSKMEDSVHAAEQKMDAVKSVYGAANPEYKQASNALAEITRQYKSMQDEIGKRIEVEFDEASHHEQLVGAALQETKAQSDALNASSLQYQELKREAESNKSLYLELFTKVKEVGINGAFQGSEVRIADQARPTLQPVFPNKRVFISLGFLLSLILSSMTAILYDMFDKSLRDPVQARRVVGLDVIGILPYVRQNNELSPRRPRSLELAKPVSKPFPDSWFNSASFYEESANALLSTLCMTRVNHSLKTVLVTSAQQGEGKSSCIAHLAASHARQGYKTLLIDADVRRPAQHELFHLDNSIGVADAVQGRVALSELRQLVPGSVRLDVVTAGYGDSYIYEGVGRAVEKLLAEAKDEYDMIFVDAPPMLCFAEPIQIAAMVDGVLVVCQAGETNRQAVSGLVTTLHRIGASLLGIVLNQVQQNMSSSYKPYQTYYRPTNRKGAA